MLNGGASAVIHYNPSIISTSSSSALIGGTVVLMEPSSSTSTGAVNSAVIINVNSEPETPGSNNGSGHDHSPINLPSTASLYTQISK